MTATLCSARLAVPEAHVMLPSPASSDASPQRSPSAAANQYVPMTRPLVLSALLISIGTLGLGAERPSKPDIVIMMADDMGMGDTSAYLGKTLGPNARPIAKTLRTPTSRPLPGTPWSSPMPMPLLRCAALPGIPCSRADSHTGHT